MNLLTYLKGCSCCKLQIISLSHPWRCGCLRRVDCGVVVPLSVGGLDGGVEGVGAVAGADLAHVGQVDETVCESINL